MPPLPVGRLTDSLQLKKLRAVSCMPAFLLTIAGSEIAVTGLIYLDGVISQRLAGYIPLAPDISAEEMEGGKPSPFDE